MPPPPRRLIYNYDAWGVFLWVKGVADIRKNVDLTIYRELTINTEDTCATTCWLLNIPIDHPIDGRPVMVISQKGAGQLMHDK